MEQELHAWVKPMQNLGIGVYQYGYSACEPGHTYGPAVRDHFLLHFIMNGSGIYSTESKSYPLGRGEGFLIFPDRVTTYRAADTAPWSYYWIGFSGENATFLLTEIGLTPDSPIFRVADPDAVPKLYERAKSLHPDEIAGQLELTSLLYALLARLSPMTDASADTAYRLFHSGRDYAESAALYIRQCYASPLTVAGIAERLGLERTYFSTVFKKYTGMSPRDYLIRVRMEKARALLSDNRLQISDVARTVGYEDPLLFSRIFREHVGLSPRAYRAEQLKGDRL